MGVKARVKCLQWISFEHFVFGQEWSPELVQKHLDCHIPYILKSNPHPFYSFRGLKNQMQIIIACELDSRSRAGFWNNDRATVRAERIIQYKNLLFIRFAAITHN